MNLLKPFQGNYPITQTFAEHEQRRIKNGWAQYNGGIDWGVPTDTIILAADAGKCIKLVLGNAGYGNYVVLDHGGGLVSLYAHLKSACIIMGQVVAQGQMIARSDNTGNSTGPHLHFEVRLNGVPVDPDPLINSNAPAATVKEYLTVGAPALINAGWRLRGKPIIGDNIVGQSIRQGQAEIIDNNGDWVAIKLWVHKDAIG